MESTKHTARMVAMLMIAVGALVYFVVDGWQNAEPQQAAVLRAYAR